MWPVGSKFAARAIAATCSWLWVQQACADERNACATDMSPAVASFSTAARDASCGLHTPYEASGSGFEITAVATAGGAYWNEADDPRAEQRLTLASEPELNHSLKFHADQIAGPFGALDVRGSVGRSETSDALTFDRLQWADGYSEHNTAVSIGATEHLLNDRLKISTDLAWSDGISSWRDVSQPGSLETQSQSGAARWHKVDAKVFDDPDFKWSVTAQASVVEKDFSGNAAAYPTGVVAFIGDGNKFATTLSAFGVNASASVDHLAAPLLTRDAERAQFEIDGFSATVYAKSWQRRSLTDPDEWTSRKAVDGATIEITPSLLSSTLVDDIGLMPQLVSVTFERGSIAYPGAPDDDVTNAEALAMWSTKLGDTTAIFSDEKQGRVVTGAGFQGEESFIADLSQSVKFGAWRATVGASTITICDASPQDGLSDTSISGHFSVRYAPKRGPQFEASLGRTKDEFALEADDTFQQSLATSLSLSLDLTNYVQSALDRRDTRLTLEYRHDLSESQVLLDSNVNEATRNRDALLVSFGTPLN